MPIKILPIPTQKINQFEANPKNSQVEKSPTIYPSVTALNLLFTSENLQSHTGVTNEIEEIVLNQDKNDQTNNKLQVIQLKQQVSNLNSQLSVQSQLAISYKRKYTKREAVIKKLRKKEIKTKRIYEKIQTEKNCGKKKRTKNLAL